MANDIEACGNCGRMIGNLETPAVWKQHVVCGECYKRLSVTEPKIEPTVSAEERKELLIVVNSLGLGGCIGLGIIGLGVILNYSGKDSGLGLMLSGGILLSLCLLATPGTVAKYRGNPQSTAIWICALCGIIFPPAWIGALIWAYVTPRR